MKEKSLELISSCYEILNFYHLNWITIDISAGKTEDMMSLTQGLIPLN